MDEENEDPYRYYATIFERVPGSDRKGQFVAIDLASEEVEDVLDENFPYGLSDEEYDNHRMSLLSDATLWMYVEGDDPEGPDIAYFEVDADAQRIIGPA